MPIASAYLDEKALQILMVKFDIDSYQYHPGPYLISELKWTSHQNKERTQLITQICSTHLKNIVAWIEANSIHNPGKMYHGLRLCDWKCVIKVELLNRHLKEKKAQLDNLIETISFKEIVKMQASEKLHLAIVSNEEAETEYNIAQEQLNRMINSFISF